MKTIGKPHTLREIAEETGLALPSARVFCSRKVKSGQLLRARRDLYLSPEVFKTYQEKDFFRLANLIQTPSYVSFATALSYHGFTTQLMPDLIESANPIRPRVYQVGPMTFRFYYCRPPYYFGFERKDGLFIAEPEKALLDSLYLVSLGRYALDQSALSLSRFPWNRMEKWLKKYSLRFKTFYRDWRKHYDENDGAS